MVWQNVKGLDLDKRLRQLEKAQVKLHNIYYQELILYEKLRSSEKIKHFAKEHLHMVATHRRDFKVLGIRNKQKLVAKILGGIGDK
ncbi:MAG: hypothetical protein IEMM0008_1643 [bacterium]|nr:MAG: hypothetical protein IEMM0008_1643 [bacterium]